MRGRSSLREMSIHHLSCILVQRLGFTPARILTCSLRSWLEFAQAISRLTGLTTPPPPSSP